jgi:hypothetical protein
VARLAGELEGGIYQTFFLHHDSEEKQDKYDNIYGLPGGILAE